MLRSSSSLTKPSYVHPYLTPPSSLCSLGITPCQCAIIIAFVTSTLTPTLMARTPSDSTLLTAFPISFSTTRPTPSSWRDQGAISQRWQLSDPLNCYRRLRDRGQIHHYNSIALYRIDSTSARNACIICNLIHTRPPCEVLVYFVLQARRMVATVSTTCILLNLSCRIFSIVSFHIL